MLTQARSAYEAQAMPSDDEIIALALAHRERVTSGRASIASAGEDLMRELLKSPPLSNPPRVDTGD